MAGVEIRGIRDRGAKKKTCIRCDYSGRVNEDTMCKRIACTAKANSHDSIVDAFLTNTITMCYLHCRLVCHAYILFIFHILST